MSRAREDEQRKLNNFPIPPSSAILLAAWLPSHRICCFTALLPPTHSLDVHQSHRNWFANVHSKLNWQQWGRQAGVLSLCPPYSLTLWGNKMRHLHEKEKCRPWRDSLLNWACVDAKRLNGQGQLYKRKLGVFIMSLLRPLTDSWARAEAASLSSSFKKGDCVNLK